MDRFPAMDAFVRAVDASSFSSVAKQLRIGQPAVSKTIAQLEDRLGVRLLLRSTHGLKPTDAGRNFYDRAKRSIEHAEEAELATRGAAALPSPLRACTPYRAFRSSSPSIHRSKSILFSRTATLTLLRRAWT
jgi:DNA-binding transcriptional LysR family regulator